MRIAVTGGADMCRTTRNELLQHEWKHLVEDRYQMAYDQACSTLERAAKNLMLGNPTQFRACYGATGHFYFTGKDDKMVDILQSPLTSKAKKELQYFYTKYQDPFRHMFGHRYRKITLKWDENNKLVVLR